MKNKVIVLCFLIHLLGLAAHSQPYEIDFKNPESVLNAVFYVTKTKDYGILQCLGDPMQKSNGNVKRICSIPYIIDLMNESSDNSDLNKFLDEFFSIFETGRISGQTIYEKTEGIEYANVPFLKSNSEVVEQNIKSMKLVKRYGNWYLYSF
jgi:hypothetical protein